MAEVPACASDMSLLSCSTSCPHSLDCLNHLWANFSALDTSVPSHNSFSRLSSSLCLCRRWQGILHLLQDMPSPEKLLLCRLLKHLLQRQLLPGVHHAQFIEKAHDLQLIGDPTVSGHTVEKRLQFLTEHLGHLTFPGSEGSSKLESLNSIKEKYSHLVTELWDLLRLGMTTGAEGRSGDGEMSSTTMEKVTSVCHLVLFHPLFEDAVKERARHILIQQIAQTRRASPLDIPFSLPSRGGGGSEDLAATPVSDGVGVVHLLDEDTASSSWKHGWKGAPSNTSAEVSPQQLLATSSERLSTTTSELESSLDIMTSSSSCFVAEHDEEEENVGKREKTGERITRRTRAATETSQGCCSNFTARSLPPVRMYSMSVSCTAEALRHFSREEQASGLVSATTANTDSGPPHHDFMATTTGKPVPTSNANTCPLYLSTSLMDINDPSIFDKDEESRNMEIAAKQPPGMKNLQTWLKTLRLHKYTHLFQGMTYESFVALSEKWLIDNEVTQGARKKILSHLEELRQMKKDVHELRERLERSIGRDLCRWQSQQQKNSRSSSVCGNGPWVGLDGSTSSNSLQEDAPPAPTAASGCNNNLETGVPPHMMTSIGSPTSTGSSSTGLKSCTSGMGVSTYSNLPPPSEMKRWCSETRFLLISPNSLEHTLNADLFAILQILTNFHLKECDQLAGEQLRYFLETLHLAQRCEGLSKQQLNDCTTWYLRIEHLLNQFGPTTATSSSSSVTGTTSNSSCITSSQTSTSGKCATNNQQLGSRSKKTQGIQRALSLSCSSTGYPSMATSNNTMFSKQTTNPPGLSRSASWKAKNNPPQTNNSMPLRGGAGGGGGGVGIPLSCSANRPQVLPPFSCHNAFLQSPSGTSPASLGNKATSSQPPLAQQGFWPPDAFTQSAFSPQTCYLPPSPGTHFTAAALRNPVTAAGLMSPGGGAAGVGSVNPNQMMNAGTPSGNYIRRPPPSGASGMLQTPGPTPIGLLSNHPAVERTISAPFGVTHAASASATFNVRNSNALSSNFTSSGTTSSLQPPPLSMSLEEIAESAVCQNLEFGSPLEQGLSRSRAHTWLTENARDSATSGNLWEFRGATPHFFPNGSGGVCRGDGQSPHEGGAPHQIQRRSSNLFSLDESAVSPYVSHAAVGRTTEHCTGGEEEEYFKGACEHMFPPASCESPHNDMDLDLQRLALDVSTKGMDECN